MFEKCFPTSPFRQYIKQGDCDNATIREDVAIKWFSVCSFDKPRFAILCTTKYTVTDQDGGRVVIYKIISITAIQCHSIDD